MKKTYLQIVVNLVIILISAGMIYISKCISGDSIIGVTEVLGSDFVFALISAMLGTLGWRMVEDIYNKLLTSVTILYLLFSMLVYTLDLAAADKLLVVLPIFIRIDLIAFVLIYIVENTYILRTLNKRSESPQVDSGRHGDDCSYAAAKTNT